MAEPVPTASGNDTDAAIISISPTLMEKLRPHQIVRYGVIMQGGDASPEAVERIKAELDAIEATHDVNNHEFLERLYPDELLAKYKMPDGQPVPGETPDEQRRYICDVMMPQAVEKMREFLARDIPSV